MQPINKIFGRFGEDWIWHNLFLSNMIFPWELKHFSDKLNLEENSVNSINLIGLRSKLRSFPFDHVCVASYVWPLFYKKRNVAQAYLYLSWTFCLMSTRFSAEISRSKYSDKVSVAVSKSFWFSCKDFVLELIGGIERMIFFANFNVGLAKCNRPEHRLLPWTWFSKSHSCGAFSFEREKTPWKRIIFMKPFSWQERTLCWPGFAFITDGSVVCSKQAFLGYVLPRLHWFRSCDWLTSKMSHWLFFRR